MNVQEALSGLFLFRNTDFAALDAKYNISAKTAEKIYSDGELIMDAGYREGLPVVTGGSARIISGDSDRSAVLRVVLEGESFGAGTLFSSKDCHSTKVRSIGECRIALLPLRLISEILQNEPQCSINYISFLSDRIAFLNKKITAFTAGSAEAKLAVYLIGLAADSDGTAVLDTSLSALSTQLGIGRASLYRALDSFEADGIIKRSAKKVTLLKPDVLRSMIQ